MSDAGREEHGSAARYYDSIAQHYGEQYDLEHAESAGRYPQNYIRLQILMERLSALGARSVYEVGTGEGTPLARMSAMGLSVAGCDISKEMVRLTSDNLLKAGESDPRVQWGDIEDAATIANQVSFGPFDSVVAFGVMPHVGNDSVALGNMRSLLAPGGTLFVEFRNKLFSLFTFNRYTRSFILDDLLAGVAEDVRQAVAEDIDGRLALDQPPAPDPASSTYEATGPRFHNPLEVPALLESEGFREPRIHWYHFHAALPMLEARLGARFRAASRNLEQPDSWRGYFLCSAFVVEAKAP